MSKTAEVVFGVVIVLWMLVCVWEVISVRYRLDKLEERRGKPVGDSTERRFFEGYGYASALCDNDDERALESAHNLCPYNIHSVQGHDWCDGFNVRVAEEAGAEE